MAFSGAGVLIDFFQSKVVISCADSDALSLSLSFGSGPGTTHLPTPSLVFLSATVQLLRHQPSNRPTIMSSLSFLSVCLSGAALILLPTAGESSL